jgi:hypothetical protein
MKCGLLSAVLFSEKLEYINSPRPAKTKKYVLSHITPANNNIISGYVLNIAKLTPESK